MKTQTDEIADGIYRFSTCVADAAPGGFTFNQFLIKADEPLLFHTGPRRMFPLVSAAIARVIPLAKTSRWVTFGHVESDECGAMNELLAAAPRAQVAHGALGCAVSLDDLCDRPPRKLADGEVIDLGGRRRRVDTPHVPHNWEARVLFEETTGTLFCGDLFTQVGDGPALTSGDIVAPALAAEELFRSTALSITTAPTIRRLAALEPRTLALMHGPSTQARCRESLLGLAGAYESHARAPLRRRPPWTS